MRRHVSLYAHEGLTDLSPPVRKEAIGVDVLVDRAEIDKVALLLQLIVLKAAADPGGGQIAGRDPGKVADLATAIVQVVAKVQRQRDHRERRALRDRLVVVVFPGAILGLSAPRVAVDGEPKIEALGSRHADVEPKCQTVEAAGPDGEITSLSLVDLAVRIREIVAEAQRESARRLPEEESISRLVVLGSP